MARKKLGNSEETARKQRGNSEETERNQRDNSEELETARNWETAEQQIGTAGNSWKQPRNSWKSWIKGTESIPSQVVGIRILFYILSRNIKIAFGKPDSPLPPSNAV